MANNQLIKQTVTVKKVLGKAASKYGKASIIVPVNGKDEFLGLNDGVDENSFEAGKTYDIGVSVSKTGKRYVAEFIGESGSTAAAPVEATHTGGANTIATAGLDREVRITYMNIANVAASLVAGDIDAFDKAFDKVVAKYKELGVL